jgi:2-keto-4-pentenoate hydratase/2-oxohepta-3-ene-1,7-dioic acid hydratase in catechol pathway
MKLARILAEGRTSHAVVRDDGFHLVEGSVFGDWTESARVVPRSAAGLLAPVDPPQILAIGLNYRRHATESGMALPDHPLLFVKTANTIVGPAEPIRLPAMAPDEVDYEAELVLVVGKKTRNVAPENALDALLGFTCGNDVSARDCQLREDKQWARGKCFDTFAPIGPWVETDMDPDHADISLSINGETMQDSNTSDMVFSCAELVSYLSRCMTLLPGSIVMTGTPEGVGFSRKPPVWLKEGDTVRVEIEGIGSLENPVVREE